MELLHPCDLCVSPSLSKDTNHSMPLEAIELKSLNELYEFVESTLPRTGLFLRDDAPHSPWARAVAAELQDVKWLYPLNPFPTEYVQHLCNFAHHALIDKGMVLLERGRVVGAIDVDAVGGSAQPHRLAGMVRAAFEPRRRAATAEPPPSPAKGEPKDPYGLIGASPSDSDDEIRAKYKQAVMEYHPDRVAHLGQELRDLAASKTTAINAAYAAIRRQRRK